MNICLQKVIFKCIVDLDVYLPFASPSWLLVLAYVLVAVLIYGVERSFLHGQLLSKESGRVSLQLQP